MKLYLISRLPAVALLCGLICSCNSRNVVTADYNVAPVPSSISSSPGEPFVLKPGTAVCYSSGEEAMRRNAEFLSSYINDLLGFPLDVCESESQTDAISLVLSPDISSAEGYKLEINSQGVTISGSTPAGVFYGIQTLRKSIPPSKSAKAELPPVVIDDQPRFSYRGMMLDVGRHFFTVDEVKTYLDMLALHNINRLHWHLSDDQGWRIEIKKYPKLTEIGSQRSETVIGRNSGEYDGIPYGGFYTQDEAREIVEYAAQRYITVIPEIDLPGHMQAALAAYPELGCTGGPYEVWRQWGVSDNVLCAGNDQVIEFIKDVLAEIVEIFPSEYIHVGGDECPKTKWETCPKCQARIAALGLKSDKNHSKEERLQSFVIRQAEDFLATRGRKMIGWDETLEGGLAPNATVMSWRGEAGGIEAARQHHDVIMSPNSYLYFDYYQSMDIDDEPLAIGGYLPLDKIYSYEPMPEVLNPEEQSHIVGVQANLWTEYIPTFSQVQYMTLPRMAALAESQWCSPENKDYEAFLCRASNLTNIYKVYGWNYAPHIFNVRLSIEPDMDSRTLNAVASTVDNAPIHYSLDGSVPTAESPLMPETLKISESAVLRTAAIRPDGNSPATTDTIVFNKATLKPISMLQPINKQYEFKGAVTLVDGMKGIHNFSTGHWIAFYKNDMVAVVDLLEPTEISRFSFRTCVDKGAWVMDARSVSVEVSDDGQTFRPCANDNYPAMKEDDPDQIYTHSLSFEPVKARYVKLTIVPEHKMPAWHGGKGYASFMFIDEISLE